MGEFGSVDEGTIYSGYVWVPPGFDPEESYSWWIWNGTGWARAFALVDEPDYGVVYEDYRDLPGWTEDCFDCPEWGWVQNEEGGWEWHAPDGTIWTYDPMGNWSPPYEMEPVSFVMETDDPENDEGYTYEPVPEITDLPGYDEDCEECPEWGWVQNEDGSWEWHSPTGEIITLVLSEEDDWVWSPEIDVDEDYMGPTIFIGWKDYTDLPGWIEECEECPEWGWEQKEDGVWVWNDPLGNVWFPQEDGSWTSSDESLDDIWSYELLPGWIEECHCEDQGWGWVDVNDDGIDEWQAPDGSLWGEIDGIWQLLNEDGTPTNESDIELTYYGSLPGYGDTCFENPGTTAQPTPTPPPTPEPKPTPTPVPDPTPTPTPQPDPTPEPTPTPTTPGIAYAAPYTNYSDTSCSSFISRLEPPYNPEDRAPGYRVELTVTTDAGAVTQFREIATGDIDDYYWQEVFTAGEMFPGATQWPSLDGGFPTWSLTGYALPAGPGGPLGLSETISGTINLAGCGGGGAVGIAPQN